MLFDAGDVGLFLDGRDGCGEVVVEVGEGVGFGGDVVGVGVGDEFAGCAREGVHPVGGVEAEGVPAGVPGGEGAVFFEDEVVDGVLLEEVA